MTNEQQKSYDAWRDCEAALWHAKQARTLLKRAGAVRSARRVSASLDSIKGAVRNADMRRFRAGPVKP